MNPAASADQAAVEILVTEVVDEFMERLRHGEKPAVEEYAARHPALASLLRELLPALQVMGSPSLHSLAGTGPQASAPPVSGCLGDFYLLRQIGQGGMGIVYEAEQLSLVRRVALKVLPFAAALDAKQLQRFKNEAQAAAHLHHPNIVPVYTVGCERGVHYYAMQFIEGQSLATMIQELSRFTKVGVAAQAEAGPASSLAHDLVSGRWAPARVTGPTPGEPRPPPGDPGQAAPTREVAALSTERSVTTSAFFRTVALWGQQAALALDHAHQLGVVHRDIKPGNLLVDGGGSLWITDFGLARLHGDHGLTVIGDLLGTLRYMSPEQAEAGRHPVDHRTDIYSLGMSLYELVTLQPAFTGADRHELLGQVAGQEPLPPRRLNPAMPAELEIILLKATAKNPSERYATAEELAEDLARFLEDKPIRARRPSLLQRLKRRLRRHKGSIVTASACAAAMLVLAVVVLAVSNRRISQEQAQTREALAQAKANSQLAEEQKQRAEANFQKARSAVDQMLTEVSQDHLLKLPQMAPVRRALLEKALTFYRGFLEEKGEDANVRFETGRAYCRVGGIYSQLGQPGPSEKAMRQGLELLEKLLAQFPAEPRYCQEVANVCSILGSSLRQSFGRPGEAEPFLRRALDLCEKSVAEFPTDAGCRQELARSCHTLGYQLWDAGRLPEAEQFLQRALVHWDKAASKVGTAQCYNSLGLLFRTQGKLAEAEQVHRTALDLVQDPPLPDYISRSELARSHAHLGIVLARKNRFAEAEAAVRAALTIRGQFVVDWPTSWWDRQELALTYLSLGRIREASGHADLAEEPYRQAVAIQEKLQADFPEQSESWRHLAGCCMVLGKVLHEGGREVEAEKSFRLAAQAYRQFLEKAPANPNSSNDFAWFLVTCPLEQLRDAKQAVVLAKKAVELAPKNGGYWNTLGVARYRAGDWKAASAALEKSMELRKGGDSFDWLFLAMAHWRLDSKEQARQWYEQACKWMDKHQPANEELKGFRTEAAALIHE
jgi:eukaryotic-like serine/threonine-protein kinase